MCEQVPSCWVVMIITISSPLAPARMCACFLSQDVWPAHVHHCNNSLLCPLGQLGDLWSRCKAINKNKKSCFAKEGPDARPGTSTTWRDEVCLKPIVRKKRFVDLVDFVYNSPSVNAITWFTCCKKVLKFCSVPFNVNPGEYCCFDRQFLVSFSVTSETGLPAVREDVIYLVQVKKAFS